MMTLRLSLVTLALIVPVTALAQGQARDACGPERQCNEDAPSRFGEYAPYLFTSQTTVQAQAAPPQDQTAPGASTDRVKEFVDLALLSPAPYVIALGGGVIDQIVENPREWTGNKGFGQRTLARVASGFVSDAVGHSVAALLHHRVRYEPCICSGAWNRSTHALAWGFVTRHDNGEMVMHTSNFIAKFTAAGLANAWYPSSYTGADVAREGAVGIGVNALLNVAREFAPELKRLVGIR
jgi:hypothetical protein